MHSTLNRFSVAPMLDWTDRHCRHFHRILTKKALLYTEMITTGAILNGKGDYLAFDSEFEAPISLQLGGSDPVALAECAKKAQQRGYNEINLNVGCPSDRVQNGFFGACLMAKPDLVAQSIEAMQNAVSIPVTVKTRIGIDECDDYAFLTQFIEAIAPFSQTFIVHARKAWLFGLSPKQNRDIPPLDYERVYQLKRDHPELTIAINGGITSIEQAKQHLKHVDGVMIGREAYHNPMILAQVDSELFNCKTKALNPFEVVHEMIPYIETELKKGSQLNHITRHILGLFNGYKGAKKWRQMLSGQPKNAEAQLVLNALAAVESAQ